MTKYQIYERERDSLLTVIEQNQYCNAKEYNAKTIKAGDHLEVQIYETWPTNSQNKGQRKRPTRKEQADLNHRYAQLRLIRLVNANFTDKDTMLTLTYEEKPTEEEAYKRIRNYILAIKRKFKDIDVKYIYCTESGDKRVHHHLLINISDRDTLEDMWCSASERARKRKNPNYKIKKYGRTQARRLQPDDYALTGLAMYMSKDSKVNKKKYCCSKNLTKPVETKTKTLKGKRITRAFVRRLAEDESFAKFELLKLFPNCQFNDIRIKQTPYTRGYYIYARLKIIEDSGINKRRTNEKVKSRRHSKSNS